MHRHLHLVRAVAEPSGPSTSARPRSCSSRPAARRASRPGGARGAGPAPPGRMRRIERTRAAATPCPGAVTCGCGATRQTHRSQKPDREGSNPSTRIVPHPQSGNESGITDECA